jgi:dUTP pyrophosphatase
LYAAEHILLDPGYVKLITTGWRIEVPEGFFLDIRPRSGLACSGVTINNAPGIVDADYRGELGVVLVNHGHFPYRIEIGDRIAQCALMPVVATVFAEVNELTPTTRGQKGFGSTG